jgi:hypothetical protein
MQNRSAVIPMSRVYDRNTEESRANTRRVMHEYAVYVVWHLSLTKPADLPMRILLNDMLRDWMANDYSCGNPDCSYCQTTRISYRSGFRSMFRNLIGKGERKNT